MPHNIAHRKLGRVTEHRIALLRNQATALLRHERIETTLPKAKELRPFRRGIITVAKRSIAEARSRAGACPPTGGLVGARPVTSRSRCRRQAVRYARAALRRAAGGYTRILRLGFRRGDSAEIARIELVGSEFNPNAETEKTSRAAVEPKKGVGDRLRAAAQRIRGKKDEGAKEADRASQQRPGATRRITTPRKAGGG